MEILLEDNLDGTNPKVTQGGIWISPWLMRIAR